MDWDTYMETLNSHQAYLENAQMVCLKWAEGERSHQLQTSEIGRVLQFVELNPHRAHRLVEVILSRQVEFNKAVIAMLTDLDYRKEEKPASS